MRCEFRVAAKNEKALTLAQTPRMFFSKKIKFTLLLCAMLLSGIIGAVLALKISTGTEFSDAVLKRKIQENVSEKISRIRATQGDILELAVLESTATFELRDSWENVPAGLGQSIVTTNVPAVYRFFVKISDAIPVQVEKRENAVTCTVIAPKLQPVLPVAFDTSRVTQIRNVGWLRFNREEMSDALQKKISMRLVLSAKNHARSPAVRNAAREAFEKFVTTWLSEVRELRERPDINLSVKILFEDEVPLPEDTPQPESVVPVSI